MEIIKQMKDAIRYMEDNLLDNITFNDVAEHIYMSSFNFHRTFKIFTNITPNEYIRNRRLSKAAEEIMTTKNILDLAMKYQYDTLEGFSKAFKRFHGVTPSVAKDGNVQLTVYHPLQINISFEGGKGMNYKVVTQEPFTLLTKTKKFQIDAEVNLIPSFWDEQIKLGLLDTLKKHAIEGGIYGACHQEDAKSKEFDYGIGMKVNPGTVVEGLEEVLIDNPIWAVFECNSVDHIGETWDYILKQFLVNSDYERVETLDYEFYPEGREDIFCELYIPVRRK